MVNFRNFHTTLCNIHTAAWKNEKFSLTEKNSSNQLFSNFLVKPNHCFHEIFAKIHRVEMFTLWKNEEFTLTEKTFVKSTNYLVTLLVKPLLSRNFSKKQWEKNFVISTLCCGDYCGNLLSRFIGKNFVKPEWFYKRSDYWGVLTTFFLGESKYFILPHLYLYCVSMMFHNPINFFVKLTLFKL